MQLFQRMVFLSFLSGIFILLGWVVQKILEMVSARLAVLSLDASGTAAFDSSGFFTGPGSGASGSGRDEGRRDASGR